MTLEAPAEPLPVCADEQVLYMVYNDLRPDLSLYNLSFMHTPNLQKLADTGTVFDRACA